MTRTIVLMITLTAILLTGLASLSMADTVPYVVVMKFLPQSPSAGPTWIGAALSTSLSWRLAQLTEISTIPWKSCSDLFAEDGFSWPETAFSEAQLADLARRVEAECLISGRYRVSSGIIHVNVRVLWGKTVKDYSVDISADRPGETDGRIAELAASLCLPSTNEAKLRKLRSPLVGSARSFELLGRITEAYWSDKGVEQARKQADEWLKIDPRSAIAEYRTASLYDDRQESLRHSRRAAELAPDHPLPWELISSRADAAEFRRALDASVALSPNSVQPHVSMASIVGPSAGSVQPDAYHEIHIARTLAHNCIDRNIVGHWCFTHGRWRDAVRTLRAALRPGVPQCRTLRNLGRIYYRSGDYQRAIQLWDRVLRIRPDDPSLLTGFAISMARLRHFDDANRYISRAVKATPEDPEVWYTWGWISFIQGDFSAAETYVRKSIELDPDNMRSHQLLQRIYFEEHKSLSALQETIIISDARGAIWAGLIAMCAVYLLVLLVIAIVVRRALRPDGPKRARKISQTTP